MRRFAPRLASTLLASILLACSGGGPEGDSDTAGVEDKEWSDLETFPGLTAKVDVKIDDVGMPHIYGVNDYDVLYAAGYQVATDRLLQLDLIRRRALGRRAEVLGEGRLGDDQLARLMDFRRWGAEDAARMRADNPEEYKFFVSWVAGVNQRIADIEAGAAPLPTGFGPEALDYLPERWSNEDPFVVAKLITFGNSNSLENELLATVVRRLSPDVLDAIDLPMPGYEAWAVPPEDRPAPSVKPAAPAEETQGAAALPDGALERAPASLRRFRSIMDSVRVQGSNNWAIDGRFTANGRPILCNDPHQPLESPSVMYGLHLNTAEAGGELDVVGFGFVGAPGVQLGHNRGVQWAATTGFADVMDIWSITLTGDGLAANVGGEQVALVTRDEVIKVKGAADEAMTIREVPGYGLLLDDFLLEEVLLVDAGRKALFNWTGFRATNEALAFVRMMQAGDVAAYEAAVDTMEVGTFNFVSADASDISYRVHVLIPDRGDPSARTMPFEIIDGDDVGSYWTGAWLPREKMPASRASATGYIVTANNDPWGFTADGDVGNDPWYYGTYYAPGFRARRIEDRVKALTTAGGVDVAAMEALQLDVHSLLADAMIPALEAAYANIDADEALAEFRERPDLDALAKLLTQDWDRAMRRDSAGALAFHVFLHLAADEALRDDLSLVYEEILGAAPVFMAKFAMLTYTGAYANGDAVLQEGRDRLLLQALDRTAAWLSAEFGGVDPAGYSWGARHGAHFRSPAGGALDGGWIAVDGGEDTVNVSSSRFLESSGELGVESPIADRFDSHDGPVFRVVTEFDDAGTPVAYMNFPRGNSGEPTSPHWDDTLGDWVEGVYRRVPFSAAEVDAATTETIVLEPSAD
ncbi:MAG: penicillin acylase family protein [Nannocystaceae bacterium]